MNHWVNNNPEYFEIPLPEFQGNPLVEAMLPPPKDAAEAIRRLSRKPDFNESERDLPSCYRALLPARLFYFMFPTTQHVQLLNRIYGQVINGYKWRNPFTILGQKFLHGEANFSSVSKEEKGGSDEPQKWIPMLQAPANISFLTGLSGMGKSTLIRSITRTMGQPVLRHSTYKGQPFPETQILYLMRNVPDQCSAKSVCKRFGDLADQLLGGNRYQKLFSQARMTRTDYVSGLHRIIASNHIGALIIDEFQNISLAKSGGKEELLAMILNLREELGVPIILVGTHRAAAILKEDASIARRLVEGGFHELKRPADSKDENWLALCQIVWRYQWVKTPQPLTDEAIQALYDCSQGITGIMLNLFATTQTYAIEEEHETVTPKLIRDVFRKRFRPLHRVIEILRENKPDDLGHYDDLFFGGMNELKNDPIQNRFQVMQDEMRLKMANIMDNKIENSSPKGTKSRPSKKSTLSLEELRDGLWGTNQNDNTFGDFT